MYKRKELIPDVTSCNDPVCIVCTADETSHLRAIGSEFTEKWVSYNREGEYPFTYQNNRQETRTTWKVIGYYKGNDGQMYEELQRIQ